MEATGAVVAEELSTSPVEVLSASDVLAADIAAGLTLNPLTSHLIQTKSFHCII